ncbi:jg10944 [Pararge aegeria aegeria]|uniref:Jg10944 protein n=1 Tax=Pararge aegeria aegeria TaxID=348720 RepID=A0A8S4S6L0_9NEOP|nr:jg10944 [Pararge aegeria aegeria]
METRFFEFWIPQRLDRTRQAASQCRATRGGRERGIARAATAGDCPPHAPDPATPLHLPHPQTSSTSLGDH